MRVQCSDCFHSGSPSPHSRRHLHRDTKEEMGNFEKSRQQYCCQWTIVQSGFHCFTFVVDSKHSFEAIVVIVSSPVRAESDDCIGATGHIAADVRLTERGQGCWAGAHLTIQDLYVIALLATAAS